MRDGLGRVQSVALIGATSDLGLAAAQKLTTIGARHFILVGRPNEGRKEAAKSLEGDVTEVDLDLRDVSQIEVATGQIFDGGDVDVVLLAAGVLRRTPAITDALEMADVNYRSTMALMLECSRRLVAQGHGQIVVFSSAGVTRPRPSNYVYGSSKAALDFAARGLAMELTDSGVVVTVIRPNFAHTRMTVGLRPTPLSIRPDDVGDAVVAAAINRTHGVVWVPRAVALLARVMQVLPSSVVARLDR